MKERMQAKGRVAVAISGGVDSSVTAALLLEAGYEVIGVTMQLWAAEPAGAAGAECSRRAGEAARDARRVAAALGIEHQLIDLQEQFQEGVVADFIREYRSGRTPNPCVVCNSRIKFSALLERALALGASHLATGHYARVAYDPVSGRYLLRKGLDAKKDQSYMLYRLTQEQLSRCLFPLGELTKEEVRRKAAALHLPVAAKPESQEICFIPDNDYRAFLHRSGVTAAPGPIVSTAGKVLGRHRGLPYYTIGQRRGLGLAAPKPLYVVEIRTRDNTLVVGEKETLLRQGAVVEGVNLIAFPKLDREHRITVKIRYRAPAVPATLHPSTGDREVRVIFDQPQAAVTPGQAAVFYQDDLVLGGGTIKATL